jgi:hypothetical protein
MRLSFDDHESFKDAAGSLRFNNPPSDLNTQQVGSSSMPPEERNEDICFNNPSNDSNSYTLQRMGSSTSIQETRRSEDA